MAPPAPGARGGRHSASTHHPPGAGVGGEAVTQTPRPCSHRPLPVTSPLGGLLCAWGALPDPLTGAPHKDPPAFWVRCWSLQGHLGLAGAGRVGAEWRAVCVGLTPLYHSQPEEVAQEAVEEPLVEPLLEPEGENYEESPQVRGRGVGVRGALQRCWLPALSTLVAIAVRSKALSLPAPSALGTHPCSRRGLGRTGALCPAWALSLAVFFFPHPTGGIPGIRARGIMEPCPCLFHQQHNEPPGAPCSSPAGPGRCPCAGDEQGCPCPVRSQVLPPVPFQGTVSVSLYRV